MNQYDSRGKEIKNDMRIKVKSHRNVQSAKVRGKLRSKQNDTQASATRNKFEYASDAAANELKNQNAFNDNKRSIVTNFTSQKSAAPDHDTVKLINENRLLKAEIEKQHALVDSIV